MKLESISVPSPKLSVIIPAYNEAGFILQSVLETARVLQGVKHEIVVVDDGSSDGTFDEASKAISVAPNTKVVKYEENSGKGHALCHGFGHVNGDYVAFLDADLDLPPDQLHTFVRLMERERADVVIGSKRHPQSRLDYPWHRRLVSGVYFTLVKLLFGLPIRDTQTGIKLFRYGVLANTLPRLVVKRFAFDLELLVVAHKLNYKVVEAPVVLNFQRRFGRIRLRDIRDIWIDTMAIFYRSHFLHYYD